MHQQSRRTCCDQPTDDNQKETFLSIVSRHGPLNLHSLPHRFIHLNNTELQDEKNIKIKAKKNKTITTLCLLFLLIISLFITVGTRGTSVSKVFQTVFPRV